MVVRLLFIEQDQSPLFHVSRFDFWYFLRKNDQRHEHISNLNNSRSHGTCMQILFDNYFLLALAW